LGYGIFTSNARSKKNNAPISIDSLLPSDNSNQTRRYNHFYAYIIKIIMWKIWRAQSALVDLFSPPQHYLYINELVNEAIWRSLSPSPDDISHLIGGIQHSSGESTDAIHKLSTIVQRIDQLTATIATRVMDDFAGVSDHISELATSMQQASGELDAISGQMQQAVEHFKI
jgi:hypothetical protein